MDLRWPRRRRWLAGAGALALLAAGGAAAGTAAAGGGGTAVHRTDAMLSGAGGVRLDTSYFTAGGTGRRPAVLLGHGFGGSKADVRGQAESLARHGYAVLTWSARGFGASTGTIGLNAPDGEVADVSRLVDWLAARPEVRLDAPGDPRVGVSGVSYGGAISLLAAGYDHRVDAIAPRETYWNLADALFPNDVYKKLWSGIFFSSGSAALPGAAAGTSPGTSPRAASGAAPDPLCGRFAPTICALYQRVATSGSPDAAAREQLEALSPSAVASRIKVPALIVQGQTDSLFTLAQSDAMAKAIRANGAPVAVDWIAGGHDGGDTEDGRIDRRVTAWFDHYLKGATGTGTGPAFRVTRTGGLNSTDGSVVLRGAEGDSYPGLEGTTARRITLTGREQRITNPAGGAPPAISALPGAGSLSALSSLGASLSLDVPGQYAQFDSAPLTAGTHLTGAPTVTLRVATDAPDAVLFGKLYDVSPGGKSTLPAALAAPVRVQGSPSGTAVTLQLPAVDHDFAAGHRMRLVLATTDLGYASPAAPSAMTVSLLSPELTVPLDSALGDDAAALPWWAWALPPLALLAAAALLLTGRRRVRPRPADPALAAVPLQITGLSKRYAKSADRYAVRDLSFRVEPGQVLGLLGPNGAGKTTTLRMLMGLIRPDDGEIRVFGEAVRPGAPVLSRLGAFVEGAGFLPHLTGRANLELYWQATGRPPQDARMAEALEIAGLGEALERAVRTYSQGMRQRLAIAQAMLGLPDLLILDEPTNGLDPPQIREMREVLIRYAAAGRTVIVSSHLLAEVEQSCTHLVVMDRGRLVTAGPVADIVGSADTVLVGVDGEVPQSVVDKVGELPGVSTAVREEDGLLAVLDGLTSAQFVAELVRLGVPVARVGPHRRLEDAFLTLIGGSA
ncbi:alpha/beta fold hydrolase [Actinacidiphila bryophytorum]|uniref:ABC-2 type transport system ATP-binding protein n=1 Tax=Actinacidiphila bryophytorum TaxID=1436133 RepID=A0A9W4H6D3_9ACTN|nr:alpha/beta fold hydrolase [Actinacidiphila bryophytorum]MBM9437654.1 alpha/beta fold hydrolase [Actinacidiphila bryophytorum]MBN6543606.1 alpha/beta fold hydrolase [Actinacidiphila bryophytorum]CAG7655583.1 ABC-2 type transport system ATP-binding protein [Actinacidiphila bryophytorum]